MFDFAWSELGLIGLVAVLALGPKELPQAMRALGRFTRQARKLAGEFQGHVNELMREAEIEEVRQSVEKVTSANVGAEIDKMFDPDGNLQSIEADLAKAENEMRATMSAKASLPPATIASSPPPGEGAP